MKKRKKPTNRRKHSPKRAKANVSPEKNGLAKAAAGLPGASEFPAISISARLPSPANATGRVTLARLFGTRGANWPREFRRMPFRPGPPQEIGLMGALVGFVSSPVLGAPRMVHGIAKGVRDAAREEQSPEKQVLALRMRLETGEITEAEFERQKARIEARAEPPAPKGPAVEKPPAKEAKRPKPKRRKED